MTIAVEHPAPTLADVQEAARRIAPHIRRTPMQPSPELSALAGRPLVLKLENLQRTGAFKIRGALNKLLTMDPSVAARALKPSLRIVGVQAAGAPACVDSFKRGARQILPVSTIADGIAVAQPGERTFPIIAALVDEMVTVDDDALARAMVLLLEREKL